MKHGQLVKLTHPMWSGTVVFLDDQLYDIRTGKVMDRYKREGVLTDLGQNLYDFSDKHFNNIVSKWSASAREVATTIKKSMVKGGHPEKQIEDFEYLLHHIESKGGEEYVHHCYVYDHKANLFEQTHLVIKGGVAYMDGKKAKDGTYHAITGLEPTQEVLWSDDEAEEKKIRPIRLHMGMTIKEKAEVW